jgi:hypothetical protein
MAPDYFIYTWRPGMVPTKLECPCILGVLDDIGTSPTSDYQRNYHAFVNRKYGEVWFFYSPALNLKPDRYLAYCVNESAAAQRPVWFRGTMDATAIIDDPLLIDALNMGDSTIVRGPYTSGALKAVDQTGGTYPTAYIQTSFFFLDEGQKRVQIQRYIADSHGASADYGVYLYVRQWPESAATEKGVYTVTVASTTKVDFRASGRLVSAKFVTTQGALRLGKAVFEVVPLGNR